MLPVVIPRRTAYSAQRRPRLGDCACGARAGAPREVAGMVRVRVHTVFVLGKFNEGAAWVRDLNAACRAGGCVEGKLWAVGFGKVNEVVIEYDHESYAAMEANNKRFFSNPDIMSVFRRGSEVGAPEHWPWDEVIEEAPTLA